MAAVEIMNDFHIFVHEDAGAEKLMPAKDIAIGAHDRFIYSTFDGDIWTSDMRGGERRQLTAGPAGDFSPRQSPDGRYVFFTSNRSGSHQVWRMDIDGSNPVQITRTGGRPCGVTPDGKWLFYHSFERKLLRISTDGGDEIPIYDKAKVTRPVCSPDGKFIAYFFLDKIFKIGIVDTADGSVIKVMDYGDGKSLALRIAWSPDSRSLNFVADSDGSSVLWQQRIDEDAPRRIADLGTEEVRDLAMRSDGSSFAVVRGKWIHNAVLLTGLE
jgi:Tol biopolymer transport system component